MAGNEQAELVGAPLKSQWITFWITIATTILAAVAVVGFLWNLSNDLSNDIDAVEQRLTDKIERINGRVNDISERVARIEGRLGVYVDLSTPQQPPSVPRFKGEK